MPFRLGKNKRETGGKEAGGKNPQGVTVRNPADDLSDTTVKDHRAAMLERKTPTERSDLEDALSREPTSVFDDTSSDEDGPESLSRSLLSLLQKSRTSPPVGVRKHSMSASWHSDKTGAGASSTSPTSSRTTRKWMVNRSKTNETGTNEECQELSAAPGSSQQSRKASTTEGS